MVKYITKRFIGDYDPVYGKKEKEKRECFD
jgi:hypothetical protein